MNYKEYIGVGFLAGTIVAKKILAPNADKALQLFIRAHSKLSLEDSYVINVPQEILCWDFENDEQVNFNLVEIGQ